jgi:hypothetical protein
MSKNKDFLPRSHHDFAVLQIIDKMNISGEQVVQNVGYNTWQVEKNISGHNMQL